MLVHAPERVRALALMDGVYGREWAMDAVASIESWDAAHGRWVLVWQTQCYMDLPHRLIIVRREHAAILSAILHYPDRWPPGTAVMLDRRAPERRSSIDRRDDERRRPPDAMWLTQGFTVVHVDELPGEAVLLDDLPATSAC